MAMFRRRFMALASILVILAMIAGCGSKAPSSAPAPASGQAPSSAPASSAPAAPSKYGGILKVAVIGEPPTLDIHTTTTTLTFEIMWTVFEYLYTYAADYSIIPQLADGMPTVSDGGKIYTIKLRQGVPFHNGKEMVADDVIASANHWIKLSQNAKGALAGLKSITSPDKYTVVFTFDKPNSTLLVALSTPGNGMAIYPKEVVDKYPDKAIEEYIGTGPYKFVEHVPDRYIRVQRFDKYAARSEEANGPGGKKYAYVDEIQFIPVPDADTRLAGLQSGEYDVGAVLSGSQWDTIKSDKNLTPIVVKPVSFLGITFNQKQGVFTNLKIRQAAQAAMDAEPIMSAAFGSPDLYRIDPSMMQKEMGIWYNDADKELYNQHNIEKAKQLLKEGGYNGEKVQYLTTKEYDYNYKSAVVYADQLKAAGFNVELVVTDWATLIANRGKPDKWDLFATGISVKNNPVMLSPIGTGWPGWWVSPKRDELVKQIAGEMDVQKAAAIWPNLQKVYYEEAPGLKVGDYFQARAARKNVKNPPTMGEYYFWDTYLEKK